MKRYREHLIHAAEVRVEHFLHEQVKNPQDILYGGIRSEIFEVKPTVYALANAVAVYSNTGSRFYKDPQLRRAILLAQDFIARGQRADGSIDYPSCNFYSAPDTSFCFKRLIASWRVMKQYHPDGSEQEIIDRFEQLLRNTFPILLHGGFHTPNHRWGICAALFQAANIAKGEPVEQQLRDRAAQYLREGIDGNGDGEYAERSTGGYNAVVNNAMMSMYEETQNPEYLGYVERNLNMMLYYFEPDGTVFTQNSTRQDQGRELYPDLYFYQYLFMAAKTGNPLFDAAAHKIIKDNLERGDIAPECLHIVMIHEDMASYEFQGYGFLGDYRKYFQESGVFRKKTGDFGYTVIRGKSTFLFLKFHNLPICVKIGESYCDIRNFIPQDMEVLEDRILLHATAQGWYYLPFEEYQGTSDWWKMDHRKRKRLNTSKLDLTVALKELEHGIEVTVKSEGLDRLPLRVQICVPAGCVLENEHLYLHTAAGQELVLRDSMLRLHDGERIIEIGPGYGTHEFGGHYSGEERNLEGFTVYLNDYTPYERTFRIQELENRLS